MKPADRAAQELASAHVVAALSAARLQAFVSLAGEEQGDCYFGVHADFDSRDPDQGGRRVHCYVDDDGEMMIDAMDSGVGSPAPAPYSHGLLIAYLVWAAGGADDSFLMLAQASSPVAL